MARINVSANKQVILTHEGAVARHINPEQQLRRVVMSTLLWEDQFYIDGKGIADCIREAVADVKPEVVAKLAIEAREKQNLRHVPLLLVRELVRHPALAHKRGNERTFIKETLSRVIQRPDELTEFLAIYWKDDKEQRLAGQVKKGLATAFTKFDEYSLAKYNQSGPIKLRDVLFLTHAKAVNREQGRMWKRLINGELKTPDTWEVDLSAGEGVKTSEDKHDKWVRLLKENKLGALALLRNLRNMQECSVDMNLVRKALKVVKTERVLPFRFVAAARYAPVLEPELEACMFKCLEDQDKFTGNTCLIIDVSGSMDDKLSGKSEMKRMDAACGLAMLVRELCQHCTILAFSTDAAVIPNRRGFALRDAIVNSMHHGSTKTESALQRAKIHCANNPVDRTIIITDEQSHQSISGPMGIGYVINVDSNKNGIGYGPWLHIDGWSEAVLDFIQRSEME